MIPRIFVVLLMAWPLSSEPTMLLNSSEELGDESEEDSQEQSLGLASLMIPSWLESNKSSRNVNLGPLQAFLEALAKSSIPNGRQLIANLLENVGNVSTQPITPHDGEDPQLMITDNTKDLTDTKKSTV